MEKAIRYGGNVALALQRGGGKTTITEGVTGWAIASGLRRFIITLAKNKEEATGLLENIKRIFDSTPAVLEDFPEICHPIWRLRGSNLLARGQLYLGELTNVSWMRDQVTFPTIPGSAASGARIRTVGMRGAIRGKNMLMPDGEKVRPDFIFIDDIQDKDSAQNPNTVDKYRKKLETDVAGLVGPGKALAQVMTCTVIAPDDLSDQYLTPGKRPPLWNGMRFKMVEKMPTEMTLWETYRDILYTEGLGDADAFYKKNRKAMEAGAVVPWADNFIPGLELNALHAAMKIWANSELTFLAEYQNEPPVGTDGTIVVSAETIRKRLNGLERDEVPAGAQAITAGVDVHGDILYYCVIAWKDDTTGFVIDYGTYPEQSRDYFQKRESGLKTLKKRFPGMKVEGAVLMGLADLLERLLRKKYRTGDDRLIQIEKIIVDSGYSHDQVEGAIIRIGATTAVVPSKGHYVGVNGTPLAEWKKRPKRKKGVYMVLDRVPGRKLPVCYHDANYWKSAVHDALGMEVGERCSLSLWGKLGDRHRMFSEHLNAETVTSVTGGRNKFDLWKEKPNLDNHLFDATKMAFAASRMIGIMTADEFELYMKLKKAQNAESRKQKSGVRS